MTVIHRTRHGGPPSGGAEPGREIVQLGEWFVEYSGDAPTQADLDLHLAPAPPAPTALEEVAALRAALVKKGHVTEGEVDAERGGGSRA